MVKYASTVRVKDKVKKSMSDKKLSMGGKGVEQHIWLH